MKDHNLRKIVGKNIKYYRFLNGYTQERLAEKCNLSPRYISDIENFNGNISLDTIEDIARIFLIQPYQLLRDTKSKHKVLPKRVNMEGSKAK